MKQNFIGYAQALELTLTHLKSLPQKFVPLAQCLQHAAAENIYSKVNAPSTDISFKDGFAVQSKDIANATPDNPIRLTVIDTISAGDSSNTAVTAMKTVRILSGATIPPGADAVVANEFTQDTETHVDVFAIAGNGRNILPLASDIGIGETVVSAGDRLTPGKIGMLAAAGLHNIPVIPKPKVVIIATGSEVVPPGDPLPEGKVFASNLMTLNSWCAKFGMETELIFVEDDADAIRAQVEHAILYGDAVITSGGAWTSRRDWMAKVLADMGWRKIFHRVRMGPGKAVGFGLLEEKPVFILPGGPPSNLLAFLEIALPGLVKMAGQKKPALPCVTAVLAQDVAGQNDWTQFMFGRLHEANGQHTFVPEKTVSRLRDMAEAQAILALVEGVSQIDKGSTVQVQLLTS